VILDTNALSTFVDGDPSLGNILRQQSRASIPVIVLGEFRYGIALSGHRAAYELWLDSHLRNFDVLMVDEATAHSYAALRVALKEKGQPIPANDPWIAALAMQHQLPVLSRDPHFDAVPHISRHCW
jgi:tRNA(fMet)-specific endonuclease VapC